MPGISGFASKNTPLDAPDDILGAFKEVHTIQGVNFIHKTFRSEHCVISNILTGLLKASLDQPASDLTGNTWLFLEGEISNVQELRGYLREPRALSVCGVLLALFLERGADFVTLVNGEFNIVIYQKAEKRLIILNDHISSKPMYYLEQGNNLLFGSEKKSILAVAPQSPTIDPLGLLQMFVHTHNIGGRTFIQDLKCLPPSSRLEYHQGQLQLTRYSVMKFRVPESSRQVDALVEEWCERLRMAVVRRLESKERILLSLSGGLDSRAIACAIPRDLRPVAARTRGVLDSLEVIYATEIAQRLGLDHYVEDPAAVPLSKVLPKIVWRTEGALIFMHCRSLASHAIIKERGDFIISGTLGDSTSGVMASHYALRPRGRRQVIEASYNSYLIYPYALLRKLFNDEFLRANFARLKEAFVRSFEPLEADNGIQLCMLWDLYERQPRMALSAAPVDSHILESIRPFIDKDYMDFVQTLPTRFLFGQALYQAMIHRLGPEVRDIPSANNNLKLRSRVIGNWMNEGIVMGRRVRSKLRRKILPASWSKAKKISAEDSALLIRQDPEFRRVIESFVASSAFDPTIFDGPGITDMLDQHYQGAADHADLLCALATFAVGLSYFVYNKTRRCPPEAEPLN